MTNKKEFIMKDIYKKLNWLENNTDHDIVYIAAQGSMNYDMFVRSEKYMSDVDVKAICIPSFEDIIRGKKMFSHTYIMEDNSHIDVKDIRLYIELWEKSNPSFLEILFSEYNIVNSHMFFDILSMADDIAAANTDRLLSCIKGMQMEKHKALKHPYPNCIDEINEYGYCRKQMHHLYRLLEFGRDICNGKSFRESLIPSDDVLQQCMDYKIKVYPVEYIDEVAKKYTAELKEIVDTYRENNVSVVDENTYGKLEDIILRIIRKHAEYELVKRKYKKGA